MNIPVSRFIPCIERKAEKYNPHNYDYSIILHTAAGNKYMLCCPNGFYCFTEDDFYVTEEGDCLGFEKMEELADAVSSAIKYMLDRRIDMVNSRKEPPSGLEDLPHLDVAVLVYMTPDDYLNPCGYKWPGLLNDAIKAGCLENSRELIFFQIHFYKMPVYGFTPPAVPTSDPYDDYEKYLRESEEYFSDDYDPDNYEDDFLEDDAPDQSAPDAPNSSPTDKLSLRDHLEAMFEKDGKALTPEEKFSKFLNSMYVRAAQDDIEKGYTTNFEGEEKRISSPKGWSDIFNSALYYEAGVEGIEDKVPRIRKGKSLRKNRNLILVLAFKLKMSAEETKTLFELGGLKYEPQTDEESRMMYLIEQKIYEYKTRELNTILSELGFPDVCSLAGIGAVRE